MSCFHITNSIISSSKERKRKISFCIIETKLKITKTADSTFMFS